MNFWCANDGTNWTWRWSPYLGAWMVVVAAAVALWRAGTWRGDVPFRRRAAAALGLFLVLVGIDWPLAKLGAGYVVSAQMVRQVLIVMIACPLLLFGAPRALGEWLEATDRRRRVLRVVTNPVVALPVAVVLLVAVSLPLIVNPMIKNQAGSFAMDVAWITAGFLIWMPVQPPSPMQPRLSGPPVIVYLIAVSVAPLPVAFFMTWSEFPIYRAYELAPRVWMGFDAKDDQELAAAIFQVAGGLVIWAQIVVRFVRMAAKGSGTGSGSGSGPRFRGTLVRTPVALLAVVVAGALLTSCSGDPTEDLELSAAARAGQQVAESNACVACHSFDGSGRQGPTWKDLYGARIELAGGEEVTVDADYIERAVRAPADERRAGIGGVMPKYGEDRITDAQLDDVVAFIRELSRRPGASDD